MLFVFFNGHEQNKIKADDCVTSINVCIQWALETDKRTTPLNELRDSTVTLIKSLPKKQLKIANFFKNVNTCVYAQKQFLFLKISLKFFNKKPRK